MHTDAPAIPTNIRTFLENMLQEAGLTHMDSETKETVLRDLFGKLDAYVLDKIVDYLPVEKLEEFTSLMQTNPPQDTVQKYIADNVPNAQDIFTVAFADFRNAYLLEVKKIQAQT